MTFLGMISCRFSQSTLSPSFTQEGYRYDFRLQEYHNLVITLKIPHKDLRNNVQGHMVNHTYKTKKLYHAKSRTHIHMVHVSSKGYMSTKTRHAHSSHITYHSKAHRHNEYHLSVTLFTTIISSI